MPRNAGSPRDAAPASRSLHRPPSIPVEPRVHADVDRLDARGPRRSADHRRDHAAHVRPDRVDVRGGDDRGRRPGPDDRRRPLRRHAGRRLRPPSRRPHRRHGHARLHRAAGRRSPGRRWETVVVALRPQRRELRGEHDRHGRAPGDRAPPDPPRPAAGGIRSQRHHRRDHGDGRPRAGGRARRVHRLRVDLHDRRRADDVALPRAVDAAEHPTGGRRSCGRDWSRCATAGGSSSAPRTSGCSSSSTSSR